MGHPVYVTFILRRALMHQNEETRSFRAVQELQQFCCGVDKTEWILPM